QPLYLHLTESIFDDPECGRFVGQPPLRSASDVAALWAGLRSGAIDTVCTDHAPWSLQAKLDPELSIERLRPGVENLQLLLAMLHSNADYSVYDGRQVTGWPVLTLRRGEIVFRDGQILGQPGSGRVLACGPAGRP